MARVVRVNCLVALENIATWEERDISQSAPERIILPDAFHLVHYMTQKLTWLMSNMEVFPAQMTANLNKTFGCVFSGPLKDMFISWGMDAEQAYRLVQEKSFQAMEEQADLLSLLQKDPTVQEFLTSDRKKELLECFDPWRGLKHLDAIFSRFGR